MSGYRTPFYNEGIGNVRDSQHTTGTAADVFVDDTMTAGWTISTATAWSSRATRSGCSGWSTPWIACPRRRCDGRPRRLRQHRGARPLRARRRPRPPGALARLRVGLSAGGDTDVVECPTMLPPDAPIVPCKDVPTVTPDGEPLAPLIDGVDRPLSTSDRGQARRDRRSLPPVVGPAPRPAGLRLPGADPARGDQGLGDPRAPGRPAVLRHAACCAGRSTTIAPARRRTGG